MTVPGVRFYREGVPVCFRWIGRVQNMCCGGNENEENERKNAYPVGPVRDPVRGGLRAGVCINGRPGAGPHPGRGQ